MAWDRTSHFHCNFFPPSVSCLESHIVSSRYKMFIDEGLETSLKKCSKKERIGVKQLYLGRELEKIRWATISLLGSSSSDLVKCKNYKTAVCLGKPFLVSMRCYTKIEASPIFGSQSLKMSESTF